MATTNTATIHFDPLSKAFARDPYASYAMMRDLDEPFYFEAEDTWLLTCIADIEAVALVKTMLRNNDRFASPEETNERKKLMGMDDMPYHERFVQSNMLDSEGEVHDRQRKLVFREFTPALIGRQRGMIQAFVDELLAELKDRDQVDFIGDFAAHVPGHTIGRVLGVPDEDCPQLRVWSENVGRYYNVGRTSDDKQLAEQSVKEFHDFLFDLIAAREAAPQDDQVSRLIVERNAGQADQDELISLCMLILIAGHGSTIDVLGSGMHALMRFPDQMNRRKADPALMKTAMQEMFRFEAPLPYFHRFATQDSTVAGTPRKISTAFSAQT